MKTFNRKRLFDIIQIGQDEDWISRGFDFAVMGMILINLFIALFETYEVSADYTRILRAIEMITVWFFTAEYILRVWTAEYLYPRLTKKKATVHYILSLGGIIDLLSFLPFYMPFFFPAGMVAFRMFRIIRILRLFRVNAYSDALSVILDVVKSKKDQLLSSVFVILILMTASSLCMYSLEHEAQPEVFANAFSGLWWSVSTLLTVGYGDIYPVTFAGRFFAIIISFLGVGMVAIPTGILSAGFVEQYSKVKSLQDYAAEASVRFIRLHVEEGHPWAEQSIEALNFPHDLVPVLLMRGDKYMSPNPEQILKEGDILVIGAEDYQEKPEIAIRELVVDENNAWVGSCLGDIDISRQTVILMVRRGKQVLKPRRDLVLMAGDVILGYRKKRLVT